MIAVPAHTIRQAEEGIAKVIPLLRDRFNAARIGRVRDELRAIRGEADNGTRVPVDQAHLEEMQHIVGSVCLNGIDVEHHLIASDLCTAMREIGLQVEGRIV